MSKKIRNMLPDGTVVAKTWEPGKDGNCKCFVGQKCNHCDSCKGDNAAKPMPPGEYTHYRGEDPPSRVTSDDQADILKSTVCANLAQRKAIASKWLPIEPLKRRPSRSSYRRSIGLQVCFRLVNRPSRIPSIYHVNQKGELMSILTKPKAEIDKAQALADEMKDIQKSANELRVLANELEIPGNEEGDRRPWWHATIALDQELLRGTAKAVESYSALSEQRRARHSEAQAALLEVEDGLAKDLGLGSRAELGISERHAWPKWVAANRRVTVTSADSFPDSIRSSQTKGEQLEGQIKMLENKIAGETKRRKREAAAAKESPKPESAADYLERTRKFV